MRLHAVVDGRPEFHSSKPGWSCPGEQRQLSDEMSCKGAGTDPICNGIVITGCDEFCDPVSRTIPDFTSTATVQDDQDVAQRLLENGLDATPVDSLFVGTQDPVAASL